MNFLFPRFAFAADTLKDIAPAAWILPGMFALVAALAFTIATLGPGHARTRRSLALLIVLICTMGVLMQVMSMPLSGGVSLAFFCAIFAVIYALGRFDAPD